MKFYVRIAEYMAQHSIGPFENVDLANTVAAAWREMPSVRSVFVEAE